MPQKHTTTVTDATVASPFRPNPIHQGEAEKQTPARRHQAGMCRTPQELDADINELSSQLARNVNLDEEDTPSHRRTKTSGHQLSNSTTVYDSPPPRPNRATHFQDDDDEHDDLAQEDEFPTPAVTRRNNLSPTQALDN